MLSYWNIMIKKGGDMHQRDTEWFSFLHLCGERDRDLLLGKEKMTLSDLDRLSYLTDFLDMPKANQEIWNQNAQQFREQLQQLEKMYEESCSVVSWDPSEVDMDLHEKWIEDFCSQIPDQESKIRIQKNIRK